MKKTFVVAMFGSQRAVAQGLAIKQPSVSAWPEELPDSAVGRIARLRPDVLRAWWEREAGDAVQVAPPSQPDVLH